MTGEADAGGLEGFLSGHRVEVERALERAVSRWEPRTATDAAAALRHGVTGGGKRLRPVLCVAAFEACGGTVDEPIYDLSAALEMIHAYSLMHDDLPCMDDAALRRGRPTTHVAHGEDATLRGGAALIPAAAGQALSACRALGCSTARSREVVSELLGGAGAGGMVGGQWLDLLAEGRGLGPEELDDLHGRKTGALLTAALVIGGLAAGAPDAAVEALRAYGREIGLAFQIADDILDATQSAATLGKNPSDEALEKSTYVALHGLDEARARARDRIDAAVAALRAGGLDAPALQALARYVVEREK